MRLRRSTTSRRTCLSPDSSVRRGARRERALDASRGRAPVRRDGGEARDSHAVIASPIQLRAANLEAIGALGLPVPRYEREALRPRMLHVGVGGFHPAHIALYTHEGAALGGDWSIRGVGLLAADRRIADVLRAQDHLYTLVERDSEGSRPRIVGSIVDYTYAADDSDAFVKRVADPRI